MKKGTLITAMVLVFVMLAAGCGSGQEADSANIVMSTENEQNDDKQENVEGMSGDRQEEKIENEGVDGQGEELQADVTGEDSIFIGGKVRSIAQDSFVLSRTLVDDDGMIIAMPEAGSPEEELVTIRCTDSTVYERWTIQGGGAGIDKTEADFTELEEGSGLEAQGSFKGEEFIAEKVIIEIYE